MIMLPLDGTAPTHYHFSAFGEEIINGPTKSPWRFSFKRTDETGLIYFGRRYYQPTLGRWLTPDPIGFTDGMNHYAFVHNNPLTHFDEYGLLDFGQYKTNYHEQQSETLEQLTTPIAHAIVKASELYAYADFEQMLTHFASIYPQHSMN
jgi:RHS repeat-associated protein